jgi:Holliday junction DNA helicase RuvB
MQNKIYINQDFFTQVDLTPFYTLQGQSKRGYSGNGKVKGEFIPQKFDDFIGQEDSKEIAHTIIKGVKLNEYLHFMIDSKPGMGKTSMCNLIAKELNAEFIYTIGKQIENDEDISNIVNRINNSEKEVVLFIDELDTMEPKVLKIFNSIVQSFKYNDVDIKPFLFASATINKDEIINSNPDMLNRIHIHMRFENYSQEEMIKILQINCKEQYPNYKVVEEVLQKISLNCKYNPRIGLSLLKQYIIVQDVDKVFKNNGIIKDGLTKKDILILQVLAKATKPRGANVVASGAGLKEKEYCRIYEPYLYEYGYIDRVPSRIILDKGREILSKIGGIKL